MKYCINWAVFPKGSAYDADYLNPLINIIEAINPVIDQDRYDELPDSYKALWMPVEGKE
jgi:hypothetical protein